MNCFKFLPLIGMMYLLLAACSPTSPTILQVTETKTLAPATELQASATIPQSTATIPQATLTPTTAPALATKTPAATREQVPLPLSETGPYQVGKHYYEFQDPNRGNREVAISVWYPAVLTEEQAGKVIQDAPPDLSSAPYPVILSSAKSGGIFGPHLVSYGFIAVGIRKIDSYNPWDQNLIDQPLDILFALHQVASNPLEGLEGMIDGEHAGVMGYSFDGYNSLALSGARVDPEYYLKFCANPSLEKHWTNWGYCEPANTWNEFSDHAGSAITTSSDSLWQPMTDERIRAVMPMAPDGAILFGERGLSSVDRPTLIIGATEDDICTYNHEAVYIYEHIRASDRTMISFVGKGHMMIYDTSQVTYMKHFATAFFGYYLQGREDYAAYLSEDFVLQYDDLYWGVYKE